MERDSPDPREHQEFFGDITLEELHDHLTTIEVAEIRDPEEAKNDRGNPEVEVQVRKFEKVFERYIFEFIRPSEDAEYPRYRSGPYRFTEGAFASEHYNEALHKAGEALMKYTNTRVDISITPIDELSEIEERYSERE